MCDMPSKSLNSVANLRLLVDGEHYEELVAKAIRGAVVSVWIATANLKTMMVEAPIGSRARARGRYVSFFETLGELAARGVEVCILHASRPSGPLREELARLEKAGSSKVSMRQCPRVHLKMIAVDGRLLYLGSANLTGAGLGAKGDDRRNFEMGILTDSEAMLDAAQARFDRIWRGKECATCKVRGECPRPLDLPPRGPKALELPPRAPKVRATKPVTSREGSRRTRRSPSSPR